MILSTQTCVFANRFGIEQAIEMLSNAGYDALDYSLFSEALHSGMGESDHPLRRGDYRDFARKLRSIAENNGVYFNQAHAPFPSYRPGEDAFNRDRFHLITRSIEMAGILNAEAIVVHPIAVPDEKEQRALNMDLYGRLQPTCEKWDVKVALENMWGRDQVSQKIVPNVCSTGEAFADYLDQLDDRYFTACLDLGHCKLIGEPAADVIRKLGRRRLTALHVHDNHGIEDDHTAPFMGSMDWPTITKALASIGYTGALTLEADRFFQNVPDTFMPKAARFLHDIGRHLIQMIEDASATG